MIGGGQKEFHDSGPNPTGYVLQMDAPAAGRCFLTTFNGLDDATMRVTHLSAKIDDVLIFDNSRFEATHVTERIVALNSGINLLELSSQTSSDGIENRGPSGSLVHCPSFSEIPVTNHVKKIPVTSKKRPTFAT